jgi:hypothetical protein
VRSKVVVDWYWIFRRALSDRGISISWRDEIIGHTVGETQVRARHRSTFDSLDIGRVVVLCTSTHSSSN